MITNYALGVDIGTSSTKGVLVDIASGEVVASKIIEHKSLNPAPGHFEGDANAWWEEFVTIARELSTHEGNIVAVGVSGMGPCVLLTDENGKPLRPAILYGVDTRSIEQIESINEMLGAENIFQQTGSFLTSQAVGPKLLWVQENEPEVWDDARKLFMPASWLSWNLTGNYRLDHHSASQSNPLYDPHSLNWHSEWADKFRGNITLPELGWPGEIAGTITDSAVRLTGLPTGIPVIIGTIDAWTESISIGATNPGDLMLMYGTSMFMINTTDKLLKHPTNWATVGAYPGSYNLAAGLATSGAITSWLRTLFGDIDFTTLVAEAALSPAGANGLLMLPYFAGERTPINDLNARGVIIGLTTSHTRGDIYRAALEAIAFGIRHNVEEMRKSGTQISRIAAVGGGTKGSLWTQIVSDITGLTQDISTTSIGASLGAALLAAKTVTEAKIEDWNPLASQVFPNLENAELYDSLYQDYLALYRNTKEISHRLAKLQRGH